MVTTQEAGVILRGAQVAAVRVSIGSFVSLGLILLGAPLACQSTERSASQAESFVAALNAKNVDSLLRLSADTLLFREQRWESAPDGSGFALGDAVDTVVSGVAARRAFFKQLAARVSIRGTKAVERPPDRQSLLTEQLADADPRWSRLDIFVFLRGEGDVEHTALTGIDPKTRKVAAFYVN